MGSSSTQPGMDTAATNTGVANMFMNNQPLAQTYQPMPMPSAPGSSYASLSAPGSLPGLTGSLIGSGSMPPLPKPSGPMPIPAPPPVAKPAAALKNSSLYYGGMNVPSGQSPIGKDGKPIFQINRSHGR